MAGGYKGKFSPVCSFLGYQARGSLPSNFDCDLGYTLGMVAPPFARNGFPPPPAPTFQH
jgi:pyrophosphate--fructose-6-phosphate 1-phosphotransferase